MPDFIFYCQNICVFGAMCSTIFRHRIYSVGYVQFLQYRIMFRMIFRGFELSSLVLCIPCKMFNFLKWLLTDYCGVFCEIFSATKIYYVSTFQYIFTRSLDKIFDDNGRVIRAVWSVAKLKCTSIHVHFILPNEIWAK